MESCLLCNAIQFTANCACAVCSVTIAISCAIRVLRVASFAGAAGAIQGWNCTALKILVRCADSCVQHVDMHAFACSFRLIRPISSTLQVIDAIQAPWNGAGWIDGVRLRLDLRSNINNHVLLHTDSFRVHLKQLLQLTFCRPDKNISHTMLWVPLRQARTTEHLHISANFEFLLVADISRYIDCPIPGQLPLVVALNSGDHSNWHASHHHLFCRLATRLP